MEIHLNDPRLPAEFWAGIRPTVDGSQAGDVLMARITPDRAADIVHKLRRGPLYGLHGKDLDDAADALGMAVAALLKLAASDICDECDGRGLYFIDGVKQPCICSEPQT